MSLRFRRSIKIAPGLRLNFSKSAVGLSLGVPGARVSVNTKGDMYTSAGIPGTGLYDVSRTSLRKGSRRKKVAPGSTLVSKPPPTLFAPRKKKALYRALMMKNLESLEKVALDFPEIADVAQALAFPYRLTSQDANPSKLIELIGDLWSRKAILEKETLFTDYASGYEVSLNLAPGVSIPMQYGITPLGLMYVELLQLEGRFKEALEVSESLPPSQATALSVCENEIQLKLWQAVLETTDEVENVDDATALLLIYRAIALREQGFLDAAIEALKLSRSSKSRSEEVLNKALLERALTYERMGKKSLARKDLEKILATDSDFSGVAELLAQMDS